MLKWHKPKLSVLLENYLDVVKLAPKTVRLTRQAWGKMLEIAGDIKVHKVNGSMAEQIQAKLLKNHKLSSTSCRIYRKSISPVFTWAAEKKYIKANPFIGLRLPPKIKKKVRVYSEVEFRRLIIACAGDVRWLIILYLARTTGMRKSAIQNLTRRDIDFEGETITVRAKPDSPSTWLWSPKDREERVVPLATRAAHYLTELLYQLPVAQPYVLLKPSRYYHLIEMKALGQLTDEQTSYPISNFDRKFGKLKKKAMVIGTFHQLRATCLTDLSNALNPKEVASIAGHSDTETTMCYIGIGRNTVNKARLQVNQSLGAELTPSHVCYQTTPRPE